MKLKKWLSRALVLAMVVALMIPVPVAAKSSSGKLVKSVTVYDYQTSGRWKADYQRSFTYDKKNYPSEFAFTSYDEWFLGVPVSGSKSITTAKYKYKGGSPKSAKFKDGAGKVYETRKYKKGRVVSVVRSSMSSSEVTEKDVYKGDDVRSSAYNESIAYNKNGLATASAYANASNSKYVSGSATASANNGSIAYAVTHKKGVPSMIISSGAHANSYSDGSYSYSYQENADGSWTSVYNGTTSSGKSDVVERGYATFNKYGFVVETGSLEINTATGAQKMFPAYRYVYGIKKGKATQVIKYEIDTDENGAVTKTTPLRLYKFKYAKAKADKVRCLSMVNNLVGCSVGAFEWY